MNFQHLIFTRFNLALGAPPPDERWLRHRFALFERYCLPSLRAQSNQSFRWVVLLDSHTPERYRQRLAAYSHWKPLRPLFISQLDQRAIAAALAGSEDAPYLITTTLDNDDALHCDFVQTLQTEFRRQSFELINFPKGLRLDVRRRKLYRCQLQSNPFVSLIERNQQPKTILRCLPHSTIESRFGPITDRVSEPLWLQVIHGGNLAPTGTWGLQRVRRDRYLRGFELMDPPCGPESAAWIAAENLLAGHMRELAELLSPAQRQWMRQHLGRWTRR